MTQEEIDDIKALHSFEMGVSVESLIRFCAKSAHPANARKAAYRSLASTVEDSFLAIDFVCGECLGKDIDDMKHLKCMMLRSVINKVTVRAIDLLDKAFSGNTALKEGSISDLLEMAKNSKLVRDIHNDRRTAVLATKAGR